MSLKRLAHRIGRDDGQSLVIVVICMVAMLGIAGLAIDVSQWYVAHHRAQVAADAVALAGANCMAVGGTATAGTTPTNCASVANRYVSANGFSASTINFNSPRSGYITVTVDGAGAHYFTSAVGVVPPTISATSVASWRPPACATSGLACDFIFGDGNSCGANGGAVNLTVALSASGNTTIDGNIESNGSLGGSTSGNVSLGTATYGPGGSCSNSITSNGQGGNPWTSPPTQADSVAPWPIDYSQDFPACGGGIGETACGSNGYPTFCTQWPLTGTGTWTPTIASNNIYCDAGSGSPSDPSTWNGAMSFTLANNTFYDSFVAGAITYTSGGHVVLSACGYPISGSSAISGYSPSDCSSAVPTPPVTPNYPIFYAVGPDSGSSSPALSVKTEGTDMLNGDMYAPKGTANVYLRGNQTLNTFIEALSVTADVAGNINADGPQSFGANGQPWTDALTQ